MGIKQEHVNKVYGQKFSLLDQKMLAKYFEDKDLNEETKEVVKEQWERFNFQGDTSTSLDHIFYKLYYRINESVAPPSKRIRFNFRFAQIAAILAAGIFIASGLYMSRLKIGSVVNQQVQLTSANGFRNQFKLPDGTSGWLGANSEIKYHLDENNRRVVYLDGLAYFEVVNNGSPFIVETPKNMNIEVKGTRFNVSAYNGDPSCEVVLEKGSVWLSDSHGLLEEMIPNDRIVYHPENSKIERSQVNTSDFLAWIHGTLVMKNITLKEACLKLSRFYNVEFEIKAANIEQEQVRLLLENESLDDALKLLSVIAPVNYHIQERKLLNDDSYSKKKIIITNRSPM